MATPIEELNLSRLKVMEVILNNMPDQIFYMDLDKRIIWANEKAAEYVEMDPESLEGEYCYRVRMSQDRPCEECVLDRAMETGLPQNLEVEKEDGSVWLIKAYPILDQEGKVTSLAEVIFDITNLKCMEQKLTEGEQQFKSLFDHNPDPISVVDIEGNFLNVNPATEKMTGYKEEELIGYSFKLGLHPQDKSKVDKYFKKAVAGQPQLYECTMLDKEGNYVELSVKLIPMTEGGQISGVYTVAKNITKRKRAENRIKFMAHHDLLTKLPNRNLLNKHFKEAVLASDNHKLALLFIDLDNFKRINDSLGHKAGDILIKKVSERLCTCVRQKDTVFRHSGDEFIVFVENILKKDTVKNIAKRIIDEFTKPFYINNYKVFVTPSIGISLFPEHGTEVDNLIKHADLAMYQVKKQGRNNYKFYNSELDNIVSQKLHLENELRKALAQKELAMYYQPQINLETGKVVGLEALIRWNHPKLGFISPGEFIPIAEETGLIISIGVWILQTVCQQTQEWIEAGYSIQRSAVNISIRQFQDKYLVNKVKSALQESGLDPKYLELEITESIMRNVDDLLLVLEDLKELGIQISVDDFGTGYSSLSVIQNLPIDVLKIDQSFINNCLENNKNGALVKTIIDMGYNLDFGVIAEGIEEEEQAEFLRQNNCAIGQGYLYSPALPVEQVTELLKKKSQS